MCRFHLSLALVVATGCGPALPDQLVEGRWVRYHYWADEGPPCAEATDEIDRFVDLLSAKLQRLPPADFRVEYYKLRERDDGELMRLCGGLAATCAAGNSVYSDRWTHDHEVAHAVASRIGQPPLLFAEGLGVVFGCGAARYVGDPLEPVDLAPLADERKWSQASSFQNQLAAADFTRSLIDRHGLEAFVRFYESTPHATFGAALDQKLTEAFGVDLQRALAQWQAEPRRRDGEFCLALDDLCDATPELDLASIGGSARFDTPVTCVDRAAVVQVGPSPEARIRFTADQPGRALRLRPCDATGTPSVSLDNGQSTAVAGRWAELWTPLEPGRYSFTVQRIAKSDDTVLAGPGGNASFDVSLQSAPLGQTCSVDALSIPDDTWKVVFANPFGSADAGLVLLRPESDRSGVVFASNLSARLAWCVGCVPGTRCQVTDSFSDLFLGVNSPKSLKIPAATPGAPSFVGLLLDAP